MRAENFGKKLNLEPRDLPAPLRRLRLFGLGGPSVSCRRTRGDFFCGQKVTKKPLKKLRFLRIFLNDGGFGFTLRPVCLVFLNVCPGPMPVQSLEPLPSPMPFFVGFASRKHTSPRHYRATGTVRAALPSNSHPLSHYLRLVPTTARIVKTPIMIAPATLPS